MKLDRTKNSFNNMIWGAINRIATMIGPFVVQTVIIRILGMEYIGLTGLFSSVLNVLNLAEMGVGTAIVYSMYKAIAENDTDVICALLAFYKKMYRIIGFIILTVGVVTLVFIKRICPEELPGELNIYIIYLICLVNVIISYNFYAYQQSVLNAIQQASIIDRTKVSVSCVMYAIQVVLLIAFKNYYLYVATLPFQTILTNLILFKISKRMYPEYMPRGTIGVDEKDEIVRKTKALFFYRLGATVLVSVDGIVISATLGLHILGQYNSYYYIVNSLTGFIVILFNSMTAGIGNSIVVESVEKNRNDFFSMFFWFRWLMGWMATSLLCLYNPFMKLWIGEKEMFPNGVMICFVVFFYFMQIGSVINVYKEAGGLWEYDKWRPLIASIINLALNISFVKQIGIYAILLSTIVTIMIIILPWSILITFRHYFSSGLKDYVIMLIQGFLCTFLVSFITYCVCGAIKIDGIWGLIIRLIICIFPVNLFYYVLFFKTKYYSSARIWISNKLRRLLSGCFVLKNEN